MKTIILYASKYGATTEIAKKLADELGNAALHNLKQPTPNLDEFGCIILGGSVYAGQARKEMKRFVAKNKNKLTKKPLWLFLSSLSEKDDLFTNNFSAEILQHASAKVHLGGIYNPAKSNGIERFLMKKILKTSSGVQKIEHRKIEQFAQKILKQ